MIYRHPETGDNRMLHCIEMGVFVLTKYRAIARTTPAYIVAVLLDPTNRKRYFEQNWLFENIEDLIGPS
jgi:hypothetical protein